MKKWLLLAVVCLVPTACGPGLIYPNLDWLIPMVVDDYISLDNRQADLFKARLSRQLEWHCRVQLPVYADLFEEMQQDFGDPSRPVTPDRLAEYLSRIKKAGWSCAPIWGRTSQQSWQQPPTNSFGSCTPTLIKKTGNWNENTWMSRRKMWCAVGKSE